MDKTKLVSEVAHLFQVSGHSVKTDIEINFRRIDVLAEPLQGLVRTPILVECSEPSASVGISKVQDDQKKFEAAKEGFQKTVAFLHVSVNGYSPQAAGFMRENKIEGTTLNDLKCRLINFDSYISAIERDNSKPIILKEYQSTKIHPEGKPKDTKPALTYLEEWCFNHNSNWLTVLGDYGIGKSWTLKRLLYRLIDVYRSDPLTKPLPFFVPLQFFAKAFDYKNLILGVLERYSLSGIPYSSFEYLANEGRIIFLLDSFDEMAQAISRNVIRDNLNELMRGVSHNSKAIMTSRPTYFESKAERILAIDSAEHCTMSPLDTHHMESETAVSRWLSRNLERTDYTRLCDLSTQQREQLFKIVLGPDSNAYKKLVDLHRKFINLETISQRAVIARLLTTVAQTLADNSDPVTPEGKPLLPHDLSVINESKIFEIVVYNLLERDMGFGVLNAADRLLWLRELAASLQQKGSSLFASPDEIRGICRYLFSNYLSNSDTPKQLEEILYRTCRRHAGLTTEGQFRDTSGNIDIPVDDTDLESRVGFSHNSLREFLVADYFRAFLLSGPISPLLDKVIISDAVGDFFAGFVSFEGDLLGRLVGEYECCPNSNLKEKLFFLLYHIHKQKRSEPIQSTLGSSSKISSVDMSFLDFSNWTLSGTIIADCVAAYTDFRGCDLRGCDFNGTIIEESLFDGAKLRGANFSNADVISIYVYDQYEKRTSSILTKNEARQWLYSSGAMVAEQERLNPLYTMPWYLAAQEVAKTIEKRLSGTHKEHGLAKGTQEEFREVAQKFVRYLVTKKILLRVKKDRADWIVKLNPKYRSIITEFRSQGNITPELLPFFQQWLKEEK